MRVLLVCFGNTCKSPMAVGLAREIRGDLGIFESAGISPGGSQANDKAIEVMREVEIDIRGDCPRRVSSLNLNDFDLLIAMDSAVSLQLKSLLSGLPDKRLSWDIDDLWGGNIEDYRNCAETISNKLSGLRKVLQEAEACPEAGDEGEA